MQSKIKVGDLQAFKDFIKEARAHLLDFEISWNMNNQLTPELYPLLLLSGDWDEQLSTHEKDTSGKHICGSAGWLRYRSMNKRQCNTCMKEYPWELKEGQAPLIGNNRMRVGS